MPRIGLPAWRVAFVAAIVLVASIAGSAASATGSAKKEVPQFVTRLGAFETVSAGQYAFPQAFCLSGEQAVGNGFSGNVGFDFVASLPLRADGAFTGEGDVAVGWTYTVLNTTSEDKLIQARVICAMNPDRRT